MPADPGDRLSVVVTFQGVGQLAAKLAANIRG
jgi:hypothetical protein